MYLLKQVRWEQHVKPCNTWPETGLCTGLQVNNWSRIPHCHWPPYSNNNSSVCRITKSVKQPSHLKPTAGMFWNVGSDTELSTTVPAIHHVRRRQKGKATIQRLMSTWHLEYLCQSWGHSPRCHHRCLDLTLLTTNSGASSAVATASVRDVSELRRRWSDEGSRVAFVWKYSFPVRNRTSLNFSVLDQRQEWWRIATRGEEER